jgi:nitroreductase
MSFLEKLSWRYATKKFDTKKKVSETDKNKIMEAIRMAPTSFGFQPFHVNIVESKDIREELKKNAWNQSQFTDASLIFIFSVRTNMAKRADEYIEVMTSGDAKQKEVMGQYIGMIKNAVSKFDETQAKAWAAKQTYIALGFGLAACAELGLDSCPMEGFDPDAFKKILKLPDNLYPVVTFAVGYRSADDEYLKRPKVRFPKEELFSEK